MFLIYNKVIKIGPEDVDANFNMGIIHLRERLELNKALNYFQKAVKFDNLS